MSIDRRLSAPILSFDRAARERRHAEQATVPAEEPHLQPRDARQCGAFARRRARGIADLVMRI
jgi:hypothetical protein